MIERHWMDPAYPTKNCPKCGQRQHSGRSTCIVRVCDHVFFIPKSPANKGMTREGSKGTKNGQSRLDEEKVRAIRAELIPFFNTAEVAAKYNVSKRTALSVYNRETWQWLP